MKIGLFDSGIGGLTILKEIRVLMPEYDYVFFGDTEHLPYGDRTEAEIYQLTKSGITRLFNAGAILVIVACNTASSESLQKLQNTFLKEEYPDRKVLGVIIPTVEALNELSVKRPLLIATKRTVESRKYNIELHKIDPNLELSSAATPELVPLIEKGKLDMALKEILNTIDKIVGEIDAVILGCTHYAVLKNQLRVKYKIPIISQDEIIPQKLKLYLENHSEIKKQLSTGGSVDIGLSKESEYYNHTKKTLL